MILRIIFPIGVWNIKLSTWKITILSTKNWFWPFLWFSRWHDHDPSFGPFWTSNCYIIIEYTENLIKPSDFLLKTVLDRVFALVPKFKTDQNMLILSLTSFTTKQAEQHSKIPSILSIQSHMAHTSTWKYIKLYTIDMALAIQWH